MARRRRTDLATAARALSLHDEGRSERQIGKLTGISPSTVHNIINGDHGWDKIAEESVVQRYRAQQNAALEQAARTLAAQSFVHAAKQLPKASYAQAVFGGSILVDKAQLLAGLPTEIIVTHSRVEINGMDAMAQILGQTLLQGQREIDVTPSEKDTQN